MSQQKQFEGSDIRVLLDEIRTTYGTEPTIAKAETFRSGGVMGFFQREQYRLVVEGDPGDADTAQMRALTASEDPPAPRRQVGRPAGLHYAGSKRRPPSPGVHGPTTGDHRPPANGRQSSLADYTAAAPASPAGGPTRPAAAASAPTARRSSPPAPAVQGRPAAGTSRPVPVGDALAAPRPSRPRPTPAAPTAGRTVSDPAPRPVPAPEIRTMPAGRVTADMASTDLAGDELTGADHLASLAEATEDSFVPSFVSLSAPAPVEAAPAPGMTPAPAIAEEPSFESVLRRVADMVDGPAAVPMVWPSVARADLLAPPPPPPPAATHLAAPAPEAPAAPHPEVAPAPDGAGLTAEAPPHPSAARADLEERIPPAAPPAGDSAESPGDAGTDGADEDPVWVLAGGRSEPGEETPWTAPATHPVEAVPAPAEETKGSVPTRNAADTERRLALHRVGFDSESVTAVEAAADRGDLEMAILEFFDSVPAAPRLPDRSGALIVVVGPAERAAAEASRIAGEVGADPGGVVHARPPRTPDRLAGPAIHSVEDAQEIAPGLRRGRVGVVAVETAVGATSTAWASRIIHALRPTCVVGVVDAMHKTEDMDAWVAALGGLDDLVVDNIDTTVSPARILDLDVPVSRLGQHPATAARWAATVLDRIAPDPAAADAACGGPGPGQDPRR
ncbi:MAG TPA: hypothetical protein VFN68_08315 [Acidimicrobiales bacterium]|nr:hypothetical protein [Acidimicrobiales bacterium]